MASFIIPPAFGDSLVFDSVMWFCSHWRCAGMRDYKNVFYLVIWSNILTPPLFNFTNDIKDILNASNARTEISNNSVQCGAGRRGLGPMFSIMLGNAR